MNQHLPLVSTIIPVYNAEKFLAETIESVLAQTYSNIEFLVVNDGSTDRSGEIARSFGDKVRYIEKPNGGVSSARNLGISETKGELIAFLDADDLWAPTKIEKQVARFNELDRPGLVLSEAYYIDVNGNRTGENQLPDQKQLIENILLLGPETGLFASTGVVHRAVFEKVGGFDKQLSTSADGDFLCRATISGFDIHTVTEPLAMYRQHGNQMHHNLAALEHDMNIVLEKVFATEALPPYIARLRSRAYSSLASTLAIGFFSQKKMRVGISHLARAVRHDVYTPVSKFGRAVAAKF